MKKLLNKGFTIVELVIVIAVIGILAAVLIPTFSNVIESANETADLQEAQSTLKAYTAYMTSKGTPLSDGAVFKIEETGRTYVFYKGELHKFVAEETALNETPMVKIGNQSYACNKLFLGFDTDNDGEADEFPEEKEGEHITFFFSDTQNVEFEDGSLKCKIYPGLAVKTNTEIKKDTVDSALTSDELWAKVKKQVIVKTIEGVEVSVVAGATTQLTAKINGALSTDVTFEIVTNGTELSSISGSTFTAAGVAGTVTVKVTSTVDPSKSDTFVVTITAA